MFSKFLRVLSGEFFFRGALAPQKMASFFDFLGLFLLRYTFWR
nr:MAG TPA: hypothetical protein [Caudoviricetes sp.]DAV96081.1 MAG TPA: hypothetical protein [Caudoviricetes sp.]